MVIHAKEALLTTEVGRERPRAPTRWRHALADRFGSVLRWPRASRSRICPPSSDALAVHARAAPRCVRGSGRRCRSDHLRRARWKDGLGAHNGPVSAGSAVYFTRSGWASRGCMLVCADHVRSSGASGLGSRRHLAITPILAVREAVPAQALKERALRTGGIWGRYGARSEGGEGAALQIVAHPRPEVQDQNSRRHISPRYGRGPPQEAGDSSRQWDRGRTWGREANACRAGQLRAGRGSAR